MAEVTDTDAVIESVTAGDHDGDLVRIIEAVRLRFTFGTTRQKWMARYTHDEEDYEVKEDDLTLGEARLVEKLTGTSWAMMHPASSAEECVAIIAACIHTRHGRSLKFTADGPAGDAWDDASKITAAAAVESITSYEVELPPKP